MEDKIHHLSTADDSSLIIKAADSLKAGNVIAIPTDTIYGVAACAQSHAAVQKIYHIKGRHEEKPVAICVGQVQDVAKWGKVTVSDELLHDLLPGPVTLVFERTDALNKDLNPHTHLIGIRIPDHDFVRKLALCCSEPIALTSANLSAGRSPLAIKEFKTLWPSLSIVVDGGVLGDTEQCRRGSTVVDLSAPGQFTIIREGSAYESTVRILRDKHQLLECVPCQ